MSVHRAKAETKTSFPTGGVPVENVRSAAMMNRSELCSVTSPASPDGPRLANQSFVELGRLLSEAEEMMVQVESTYRPVTFHGPECAESGDRDRPPHPGSDLGQELAAYCDRMRSMIGRLGRLVRNFDL